MSKRANSISRDIKGMGLLAIVSSFAIFLTLACPPCWAQGPLTSSPAFDVAAIKPSKDVNGVGIAFLPGGRFIARGATIKDLIVAAYGLTYGADNQVSGGPGWVKSTKFDIEAKKVQSGSSNTLMLKSLLADRFKLKAHTAVKELPVYALVVAKNGPKLTPSKVPQPTSADSSISVNSGAILPDPSSEHWRGARMIGRGQLKATRETMSVFTKYFLTFQPEVSGRLVIDKTGLTGEYDFLLQWTPEGYPSKPSDSGLANTDDSRPPLLTALQQQLGLKLESAKDSAETIVIDSVEMPSQN